MARILLADDDAAQLAVQSSLLETLGHQVDIAFSPSEALRQLARSMPGLIVMDLRFPRPLSFGRAAVSDDNIMDDAPARRDAELLYAAGKGIAVDRGAPPAKARANPLAAR